MTMLVSYYSTFPQSERETSMSYYNITFLANAPRLPPENWVAHAPSATQSIHQTPKSSHLAYSPAPQLAV